MWSRSSLCEFLSRTHGTRMQYYFLVLLFSAQRVTRQMAAWHVWGACWWTRRPECRCWKKWQAAGFQSGLCRLWLGYQGNLLNPVKPLCQHRSVLNMTDNSALLRRNCLQNSGHCRKHLYTTIGLVAVKELQMFTLKIRQMHLTPWSTIMVSHWMVRIRFSC